MTGSQIQEVSRIHKDGKNPIPVTHKEGLQRYAGATPVPHELHRYRGWKGKQIENRYSHWIWRQYASSCWGDVRVDRVLPYRSAREEEDEKHLHPLQLDVIERAVVLWSNRGENVLTPFMGVGSEVCGAIDNGRRKIGCELKESYYRQAIKNCEHTMKHGLPGKDSDSQASLLDGLDDMPTEDEPLEATA